MTSQRPSQYSKGFTEFYKLKFLVNENVLIPRPETELLVDEVLTHVRGRLGNLTILDIGTGSGCIAISLACNLEGCNVNIIATDVSGKALKVAKQNTKFHGVKNQITFIQSDLLGHPELDSGSIKWIPDQVRDDNVIIVANLPYIPSDRIPTLDSSVKDFEPLLALDGGKDGFDLYRKLLQEIQQKGWKPTLIVCEIDHTHESIAKYEAKKYFPDYVVEIKKDLAKNIRILKIKAEETQPQ